MLLFCTTLPLTPETTHRDCVSLFADWVCSSPFYPIDSIDVDAATEKEFEFRQDGFAFLITHYQDASARVTACRLENEQDNRLWLSDCIFVDDPSGKRVHILVKCNRYDFSPGSQEVRTPKIVHQFITNGHCRCDGWMPVTAEPIQATLDNLTQVASFMKGEGDNEMPVVYLSTDGWDWGLDPERTAWSLAGLAHVVIEQDPAVGLQLMEMTGGNNAYRGYIAIYLPHSGNRYLFSRSSFPTARALNETIRRTLLQCLINRWDSSNFGWEQLRVKQNRQRLEQETSAHQDEMNSWISVFDEESQELRDKITDLTRQLERVNAELSRYQARMPAQGQNGFFSRGAEPELIDGEYTDLLLNVLSRCRGLYPADSRALCLIDSMLEANPRVGECGRILQEIKRILGPGEALNSSMRSDLEHLGFRFVDGTKTHIKMYFRDKRYQFAYSTSPSDSRGGKRKVAEIRNVLDVEWKV